ncbi:uncharacterized protein A1O9_04844 [Exophiala aquamarina CBS 119918]|uniref:Nucleolar protein 14 n=1 Tax=Exophiala aquamarina CBS 119918 TaxID=1182545 RepID=A0A072PWM3_9EURO|nr:uncharacterized protein A1O9_04844 [Exophiala aquamarina CBS 119918]KEF59995.1 hypothetical protein A1O9_04844 [Exophiala aquamarina CBS 119918]
MAPSQLKQLKQSLRDHGVLGPQKSKKQRKSTSKDARKRLQRNAALEGIRERFNPFEVKAPARKEKYEIASAKVSKPSIGRPGVTRGLGEERRRDTLLKEIQSRNKVGGMLDRRFGEDDPNMTPEQKAAERFARQNERKMRKTTMFNLEDDSEEEMVLTHGGRSLEFGNGAQDDFSEDDVSASDEDTDRPSKRLRLDGGEADDNDNEHEDGLPQRKKTKNEVMKEVIAKSKMYKAERQAAKADDDEIRAELDKGMSAFYEALRSHKPPEKKPLPADNPSADPHMDPARAAMLAGKSRKEVEKEYESNLRQLKLDARSKPSVRTKTDEEKAAEEASRLEELERKRIRRMKGEAESSEDERDGELGPDEDIERQEEDDDDDAQAFGLSAPQNAPALKRGLDVEDEDEFVLDDDLIASDSEAEMASEQDADDSDFESQQEDDGDDDFINGLVLPKDTIPHTKQKGNDKKSGSSSLAYTFPCPQTHQEMLEITKDTESTDLPTIVQRIRALYHKGLAEGNQLKLDKFGAVLTEHVAYLADSNVEIPFSVLDSLLRHLHSMAKASPQAIGAAFRQHLDSLSEERPLQLTPGDLIILTGVSTIFPTSDHFHSVVTPSMLTLARYLGQSSVQSLQDLGRGAYCCSLALQFQSFAKRYVPEVITYLVNALFILAPVPLADKDKASLPLHVPIRLPSKSLRIKSSTMVDGPQKVSFRDLVMSQGNSDATSHAIALLNNFIRLCLAATNLWKQKSSCSEILDPLIQALSHITSSPTRLPSQTVSLAKTTLAALESQKATSIDFRRPLLLHNHRALAIKTSIPQFIENYNPDRHYDPDRERAELSKLKAEHRKERKGAMRELRKDASFMAREQLREKKEKDAAYERKYKRLVAEIQGEEGREAKGYERERAKRKGRF